MYHQGRGHHQDRRGGRNRRGRGRGGRSNDWEQGRVKDEFTARGRYFQRRGRRGNVRNKGKDIKHSRSVHSDETKDLIDSLTILIINLIDHDDRSNSTRRTNGSERVPLGRGHQSYPLNNQILQDLAELDPHEALHKLASYKKRLVELLNKPDIPFDLMIQLTKALANICESETSSETLLDIIETLHEEYFMINHLVPFIRRWPIIISEGHFYRRTVSHSLLPVVIILFSLLESSSCDDVTVILAHLDTSVYRCEERGVVFPDEALCEFNDLNDYHKDVQQQLTLVGQLGTPWPDLRRSYIKASLAIDDFREYEIFPMKRELKENYSPSLHENIVNGGYESTDHYLNVQFRLLREDLVKPLRDGIAEYRSTLQMVQENKQARLQEIHVYHDVRVLEAKPDTGGISHLTRFNVGHLRRIEWEKSKRLIYGSLVCLSPDHFETVIFAVVANRQARDLRKGLIELQFHGIHDIFSTLFSETFTMVESPAYFEAYRHVLKRLQDTNENNFPLKRYIVEAVPKVSLPLFLRQNQFAVFDLRAVSRDQRSLRVQVAKSWPPRPYFDLDPSQYKAFKAALTEELCLIQGPPGTGKTFIGLKIVETLLLNVHAWSRDADPSPILLICFTNHALDQFLEGVLTFLPDEGIIRIGGRSKSEKLKNFNLTEIRRNRSRPKHRRTYMKTIRDEMQTLAKNIQAVQKTTRRTRSKILHEKELMKRMTDWQYRSLMTGFQSEYSETPKTGEYLTAWLQAVVDQEETLHEDIAPPLHIKGSKRFAGRTGKQSGHVLKGRQLNDYVKNNLTHRGDTISREIIKVNDVWSLSLSNRWRLYRYWLKNHQQYLHRLLQAANSVLTESSQQLTYSKQLEERLIVSQNNILRVELLKVQMTSGQFLSLNDPSKNKNIKKVDPGQLLILWLEAYNGVPLATVQEVISNVPQESERIDIKGAAELIAEARYIEDNDEELISDESDDIMEYSSDDEEYDEVGVAGVNSFTLDGKWNIAGRDSKKIRAQVIKNLMKNDRMTEEKAALVSNVWRLRLCDRWNLYRYWVHLYNTSLQRSVLPLYEKYNKQVRLMKEVREQEDVEIVREAKIVALTTTGAAKYHSIIERVNPKIVIVEEAAEVLEAHIVTSLTGKCQHLILIGDHQQLRPNPTVYELSTRYGLDISLFERLIKNNFPRHRLNLQHRMRPEISQLLKIHNDFYPGLQDHESVLHYDGIQGIVKNIFFLEHNVQESRQHDDHSRSNRFEAEFLTSLCRYLLQQGYKPEQITILTAYTGQLWNFKSLMPKSVFGELRVCPIDSYQGEENDIILLSLVRSNEVKSIGFLKTANRVCVALSRAKKGLYCVGNFSLLSNENDLWRVITSNLRKRGCLGTSMQLVCANHPYVITEVSLAQDFKAVPEGGCRRPCQASLKCGHVCPMSCHPRDSQHLNFKCKKRCNRRICKLNHTCSRLCYELCETVCTRFVNMQMLCGHKVLVKCFQRNSTDIKCQEPCDEILICGHPCKKKCWEECTASCPATVKVKFKCGHEVLTTCGNEETECKRPCNEILRCGHRCRGTCSGCKSGRLHVECVQPCSRKLICGHKCTSACSEYCPPCEKKCENLCIHTRCSKKCWQLCLPCQKTCEWTCIHRACIQLCGEPCVVQPCNKPCRRILKCGHECIGLCGERCPTKCRICDKIDVPETDPANKYEIPARFLQLEDCGHIIEMDVLDEWMTRKTNENCSVIQVKSCPQCGTPIRRSPRYRHIIKQIQVDIEYVKKQITADSEKFRKKRKEISQRITYAETTATIIAPRPLSYYQGRMGRQTNPSEFSNSAGLLLYNLRKQVKDVSVAHEKICSLECKLNMFNALCDLKQKANRLSDRNGNVLKKNFLEEMFLDNLHWLDSLSYVGKQNEDDWNCEIRRMHTLIKLMEVCDRISVTQDPSLTEVIKKIYAIIQSRYKYSISKYLEVDKLFLELRKYDTSMLQVPPITVVNVFGWATGHWLKCEKGHIYCTGNENSVTNTTRCPECKSAVARHDYHQLDSVKRLTNSLQKLKIPPNNTQ